MQLCIDNIFYKALKIKRTSVQKSNQNDIFMARIILHTSRPQQEKKGCVFFFPQICFYFREKRTFRFHPLESMDRVITGRHFRSLCFSKILHQGKSNQSELFHRLFVFYEMKVMQELVAQKLLAMRKSNVFSSVSKNFGEENLFFHHMPLFRIPQNYVCKLLKE